MDSIVSAHEMEYSIILQSLLVVFLWNEIIILKKVNILIQHFIVAEKADSDKYIGIIHSR